MCKACFVRPVNGVYSSPCTGWDASKVLETYLQVSVRGSASGFNAAKIDVRHTYLKAGIKGACMCSGRCTYVGYVYLPIVADLVGKFGVESILIYTAMMLKKRIAIYSPDPAAVLAAVRYVRASVRFFVQLLLQRGTAVCVAPPELGRAVSVAQPGTCHHVMGVSMFFKNVSCRQKMSCAT